MRLATIKDREQIYKWRNEPYNIKLGITQKPVSWQEHCIWFNKALDRNQILLWIVDGCGWVRLDKQGDRANISIYLIDSCRSKGKGTKAIKQACSDGLMLWDIKSVHAFIRLNNIKSQREFIKAGFTEVNDSGGHKEYVYSPQ